MLQKDLFTKVQFTNSLEKKSNENAQRRFTYYNSKTLIETNIMHCDQHDISN